MPVETLFASDEQYTKNVEAVETVVAAVLLQGNATTSNTREVATRDLTAKAAVIRKLLLDTVFCEDCAVLVGLRAALWSLCLQSE